MSVLSPGVRNPVCCPHYGGWHDHDKATGDYTNPRGCGHSPSLSLWHRMGCPRQIYEFYVEASERPSPSVPAASVQREESHSQCTSPPEQHTNTGGKSLSPTSSFRSILFALISQKRSQPQLTISACYKVTNNMNTLLEAFY